MSSKPYYHLSKSEIDLFNKIERRDVKGVRKCLTDQRTRSKIYIDCFNDKGFTPLFVTIAEGINANRKQIIRILLKYGANINIQNNFGQTLLHHACEYPSANTANVIKVLVQNGAESNIREDLMGRMPLHIACRNKNIDAIKSLLLYNVDVNCLDNDSTTPLMLACRVAKTRDEMEMLTLLLEKNASIHLQDDDGHTALHVACMNKSHIAVERLLRCGADPNVRTINGRSPLHCACHSSCIDSIQILLDNNADPNHQDDNGNTPLHCLTHVFINHMNIQCARTLLERNADVNIKNNNGETPLLSAVQVCVSNHNESKLIIVCVIEVLLMFGADVNVQLLRWNGSIGSYLYHFSTSYRLGVIGDTPLHTAVRNNDKNLVSIILNHNPDLKILNNNKETIMDLAKVPDCMNEITTYINEHLYPIRCQMYTHYREIWCHHLVEDCPNNNIKSISTVKTIRKRKRRKQYDS